MRFSVPQHLALPATVFAGILLSACDFTGLPGVSAGAERQAQTIIETLVKYPGDEARLVTLSNDPGLATAAWREDVPLRVALDWLRARHRQDVGITVRAGESVEHEGGVRRVTVTAQPADAEPRETMRFRVELVPIESGGWRVRSIARMDS